MISIIPAIREQRIERIRKTIDRLAYGSLGLDICITILTLISIFQPFDSETFLLPVNYLLTGVVIASVAATALLIYLKHEETLLARTLHLKNHIAQGFARLKNKPYRYGGISARKRRFLDFSNLGEKLARIFRS